MKLYIFELSARSRLVLFIVFAWCGTVAIGEIGASQTDRQPTGTAVTQAVVATGLRVILLKPFIRLEDYRTVTPQSTIPAQGTAPVEEYQALLLGAAKQGVALKVEFLEMNSLESPLLEVCEKLEPLASRLARGNVNAEANEDLASLAALDRDSAVLAQSFRLETGEKSPWLKGGYSSTASTLIQVALVSASTGEVIWKGERLIRHKALKPTDAALKKELAEIYRDFDIRKGITK